MLTHFTAEFAVKPSSQREITAFIWEQAWGVLLLLLLQPPSRSTWRRRRGPRGGCRICSRPHRLFPSSLLNSQSFSAAFITFKKFVNSSNINNARSPQVFPSWPLECAGPSVALTLQLDAALKLNSKKIQKMLLEQVANNNASTTWRVSAVSDHVTSFGKPQSASYNGHVSQRSWISRYVVITCFTILWLTVLCLAKQRLRKVRFTILRLKVLHHDLRYDVLPCWLTIRRLTRLTVWVFKL